MSSTPVSGSYGCAHTGQESGTCQSFQIGDTIRFAERHIAAGDIGVIVGIEHWLNDNESVPWDGVGDAPAYSGKFTTPNVERFLVRLQATNPASNENIGGLKGYRERCVQTPHSYPYVAERDMELVHRPEIRRLNESDQLGSVVAFDTRQSLSCVSDSEAGARKAMADLKSTTCLPLTQEVAL
jgi:hypothetical protein